MKGFDRMKKTELPLAQLFLMGGALFSMHFGAASMIWPMTWGQESGSSVLIAFLGVYLTGIFFPLLGYIALSRGKGTFYSISSRVSNRFANIFCSITIIVLGPLFLIPRMSAAAWEAFLQITNFEPSSILPALVFSIIYYIIVYWFVSNKEKTVDKLSKILLPILLITVIGIFAKGFISPLASWRPKVYEEQPFVYGFLQGYATMELPCALIFGVIIINNLKMKGIKEENVNRYLLLIGLIGTGMLTLTHLGHMLIGSLTGDLFNNIKYSALYAQVVMELWGPLGGTVFSIGLLFAALSAATGISAATAEFIVEITKDKIRYKKAVILTLIVSAIVSSTGLGTIIKITEPLLKAVYPPAIVITLYYSLIPDLINKKRGLFSMRYSSIGAFIWGSFECLLSYMGMFGKTPIILNKVYNIFPLSQYGLGWVTIVLIASIGGFVMYNKFQKIPARR